MNYFSKVSLSNSLTWKLPIITFKVLVTTLISGSGHIWLNIFCLNPFPWRLHWPPSNCSQVPKCMSEWSGCGRMKGGSGPCCVMCCSTSRMAEPASSGSVNKLQCETLNFLLLTQCVIEGLGKLRSLETLTSIIELSVRRAEMNRAGVYITVHPTWTSVSLVFLVFLTYCCSCFSMQSLLLGGIQVPLIILP